MPIVCMAIPIQPCCAFICMWFNYLFRSYMCIVCRFFAIAQCALFACPVDFSCNAGFTNDYGIIIGGLAQNFGAKSSLDLTELTLFGFFCCCQSRIYFLKFSLAGEKFLA